MVKRKVESSLSLEEWRGIVYYVYEEDDAKYIENKIQDLIMKKMPESFNMSKTIDSINK